MCIKQDYIEKMLEEAMRVLAIMLKATNINKAEIEDIHIQLKDMYKDYLKKHYTFFYSEDSSIIIESIIQENNNKDSLKLLELLSDLLFTDAKLQNDLSLKNELFAKTLDIIAYIEKNTDTYSLARIEKNENIKKHIFLLKLEQQ